MNETKRRFMIQPKYVIFDTNCYFDDFDLIQKFFQDAKFIVTVPLIVVREL